MSERVSVVIEDGVAEVRLTRPDKRNALDWEMFAAIVAAGEQIASDASVRAVVLSGDGAGFCAGLDVALFAAMVGTGRDTGSEAKARGGSGTASLRSIALRSVQVWLDLEVPVIAAVHGVAVGGGLQIALAADIRVVAPDARLGAFEIRWGIVPDMGGTQLLPRLVGPDVAKELIMTARLVDGDEALRLGLATRVDPEPRAAALALAREIAGRNPAAVRIAKRLVDIAAMVPRDEGIRLEQELTEGLLGSPAQLEAVRANLERS